ncbi:Stk1 family PASTA domain-containing Ser/Thr kinase [Sciscionella marina]|uniref:Stk1 family PASTA domain-containing Ser/Thr kinase n=1 Tax=Sciscionella marina TaxID=508770 RepID=UPI0004761D83|nr:Stk1 family PASTA domain-containing Ser/Thr kinase [Sciscionella marina]
MTSGVADMAGTVLEGRYRVDSLLATGGMSTVYAGLDLRLERPVAIKVMDRKLADNPTFLRRFELEARAAAKLHHPNIVAVYDQGIDETAVYLVMELVSGGTLRDLLEERGPLEPALTLAIAEPVASALTAAHRAGLVHRDIKPENVLIGWQEHSGGAVKVADFGLVRALSGSSLSTGNVILGTVAYLSPEQVATGDADPRSDVYALGILLFEMLTGRPPYNGDTALSVAYRHVHEDVPAPGELRPDLPPALDNLVLQATRRDPAARQQNAADLALAIERVRGGLGLPKVPVPVAAPPMLTDLEAATGPVDHGGPSGTRMFTRSAAEVLEPEPATEPQAEPAGPDPSAGYRKDRRRSRRWLAVVLVLVLLLAALIGVGAWWFGSGRWTAVPALSGMSKTQAQHNAEQADLTTRLTMRQNNTVPAGTVISSHPAAGADALRGSQVELVVSTGKPKVPKIEPGTSRQEAEQAIRSAGLRPAHESSGDRYSPSVAKGAVLAVTPSPGTPLPGNAEVTLLLSKGVAPIKVPDVTGSAHDDAFQALRRAGLSPYDLPGQFTGSGKPGTVLQTNPSAGASVPADADRRVGVVVSTGVQLPDVTGKKVGEARSTLEGLGLKVQVHQFLQSDDSQVLTQSTPPETTVAPGTEITLNALP